ncbi:hypothetical protein [Streptomyces sp. KN37]|uniref:hypothetical protein n=1 Tax=Streptomyces sp. KN37 TaxID=3090667 RepID=UPI002A75FC7B|nr:hypothetical protein [Streptomyces sp. KN37]WPO76755.1 hypothetical protein R9806_39760 [Streptomyces sp. KN37]
MLVVFEEELAEFALGGAQVRHDAQSALGQQGGEFCAQADGEDLCVVAPRAGRRFQGDDAGGVTYGVLVSVEEQDACGGQVEQEVAAVRVGAQGDQSRVGGRDLAGFGRSEEGMCLVQGPPALPGGGEGGQRLWLRCRGVVEEEFDAAGSDAGAAESRDRGIGLSGVVGQGYGYLLSSCFSSSSSFGG